MKATFAIISALLLASSACSGSPRPAAGEQAAMVSLADKIVPRPVSVVEGEGSFTFGETTLLCVEDESLRPLGDYLRGYIPTLADEGGIAGFVRRHTGTARLTLALAGGLPAEGYRLSVGPRGVRVEGADYGGVFNGLQTLLQLLPPKVYAGGMDVCGVSLPAVTVEDSPRFAYRGMMLDIARTFSGKERVMKFIDNISHHKINKFHWHITDDEGWRVEIKSHPELALEAGFRGGESPVPPAYGEW